MPSPISAKRSNRAVKSTPPNEERRKTSAISSLIWRKAMSPNVSVLFVTTDSNCMQRDLVSSQTFIRYDPQ